MYSTISISVRLVVLSSVWYVTRSNLYAKRESMAAPPSQDPSRLGKGPSSRSIPPGTGAFVVTPSTSPNAVWTSSPAVAGSVQKGDQPALTASAKANQSTDRSLKHPGLGSSFLRDRSSVVTSISPVSAVVPDRDGSRPSLRADLDRLHAGNNPTLSVDQSPDYRHFMVTEAGFGTPAKSFRSANAGTLYVADRSHANPQQYSAAATAGNKRFDVQRVDASKAYAPTTREAQLIPTPTSKLPLSDPVLEAGVDRRPSWATIVRTRRLAPQQPAVTDKVAAKRSEVLRYPDTTKNSTTPSSTWQILRKPVRATVASAIEDATPLDDLRNTLAQLHCEYKRMHERTISPCTSGKGGPTILGRPKQLEPMERSVASSTAGERYCSGDHDTSVATQLAVRSAYSPPEWVTTLPFNLTSGMKPIATGPGTLPLRLPRP